MHKYLLLIIIFGLLTGPLMAQTELANITIRCQQTAIFQATDENSLQNWQSWQYRIPIKADLNGDGQEETILLIGNIEPLATNKDKSPDPDGWLWDDGDAWVVVIEEQGQQTLVYNGWTQGKIEIQLINKDHPKLQIINRSSDDLYTYNIDYQSPQNFTICLEPEQSTTK